MIRALANAQLEVCLPYAPDAVSDEVPGLRPSQQFDPLIFR
jgi:hypothetical protein